MTPFELVAVIEDADVRAPRGRGRIILELRNPTVLGHKGAYLGLDGDGKPQFGYTRRQCYKMRDLIYKAAREDAAFDPGGDV